MKVAKNEPENPQLEVIANALVTAFFIAAAFKLLAYFYQYY